MNNYYDKLTTNNFKHCFEFSKRLNMKTCFFLVFIFLSDFLPLKSVYKKSIKKSFSSEKISLDHT